MLSYLYLIYLELFYLLFKFYYIFFRNIFFCFFIFIPPNISNSIYIFFTLKNVFVLQEIYILVFLSVFQNCEIFCFQVIYLRRKKNKIKLKYVFEI